MQVVWWIERRLDRRPGRWFGRAPSPEAADPTPLAQTVFQELDRLDRARDCTLVVVYLPVRDDYFSEGSAWRSSFGAKLREQGIRFVDLTDSLGALPWSRAQQLFIPPGALNYYAGAGHYSEAGNRWVAQQVYAEIRPFVENLGPGMPADGGAAPVAPAQSSVPRNRTAATLK